MAIYKSFKDFAVQQLANFANATDANKVLRQAVVEILPEMKRRIQNDGKNSANVKMRTKSPKAFGAYSYAYGRFRVRTGREQVAIIDLTYNSFMLDAFKAEPTGPNSYGVGFLNEQQAVIAGYNEENFGVIFNVTNTELKISLNEINKQAQKILAK